MITTDYHCFTTTLPLYIYVYINTITTFIQKCVNRKFHFCLLLSFYAFRKKGGKVVIQTLKRGGKASGITTFEWCYSIFDNKVYSGKAMVGDA